MAYFEYIMKCAGVPEGDDLTDLLNCLRENNHMEKVGSEYSSAMQSLVKTGTDDMYHLGRLVALCKYAAVAPGMRPHIDKIKNLIGKRDAAGTAFNDAQKGLSTAQTNLSSAATARNTALNNYNNAYNMHASGQAPLTQDQLNSYRDAYNKANSVYNQKKVDFRNAQQLHDTAKTEFDFYDTGQGRADLTAAQQELRKNQVAFNQDPKRVEARKQRRTKAEQEAQAKKDELEKAQRKGFWSRAWGGFTDWRKARAANKHKFEMEKLRQEGENARLDREDRKLEGDRQHELNLMQLGLQAQASNNMSRNIGIGLGVGGVGGALALGLTRNNNQPQYVYAPPAPAPAPAPAPQGSY